MEEDSKNNTDLVAKAIFETLSNATVGTKIDTHESELA
jgi:hypothetical protein